ncbi:hypothetical protein [Variovorax sp. WS11]|nr:hypothetical protein [Variovorax sp. WS11]
MLDDEGVPDFHRRVYEIVASPAAGDPLKLGSSDAQDDEKT